MTLAELTETSCLDECSLIIRSYITKQGVTRMVEYRMMVAPVEVRPGGQFSFLNF
ncbi:hypothetical protein J3R74_004392 [Puniceicoccus vermicola]